MEAPHPIRIPPLEIDEWAGSPHSGSKAPVAPPPDLAEMRKIHANLVRSLARYIPSHLTAPERLAYLFNMLEYKDFMLMYRCAAAYHANN